MSKSKPIKLTKDMIPVEAFHPGELLNDEIEYMGIKQKELAEKMSIAPKIQNELIN